MTAQLLPSCEDCGGPVDEYGCGDDGRAWCRYCLHNCPACRAGMRDDFYPDRTCR
jgi:hypothetical protein